MKGSSISIRTLVLMFLAVLVTGILLAISTQNVDFISSWGGERINGTLTK